MKITTKLTLAAITAAFMTAASARANGLVGETADYRIYSYQVGNSQPAIVYVRKAPTVAVNVQGASLGATARKENDRGQSSVQVTIPGGIN